MSSRPRFRLASRILFSLWLAAATTALAGAGLIAPGIDVLPNNAGAKFDYPAVNFGGGEVPPIPMGFFGPGSDPFLGTIQLVQGNPLAFNPPTSAVADTVIQRASALVPSPTQPTTVPIEIVALSLTSVQPITVTYGGGSPEQWAVQVGLSSAPSQGSLTLRGQGAETGQASPYMVEYTLIPRFIFTRISDSTQTVLDFFLMDFPPLEGRICGAWHIASPGPNIPPGGQVDRSLDGVPDAGPLPGSTGDFGLGEGAGQDCDTNGIPDECDVLLNPEADCNSNGIPDECEIMAGAVSDFNSNGVLDTCEAQLEFRQLTFTDADGVPLSGLEDTDYGLLTVTLVEPPAEEPLWINLEVGGRWAIQNAPAIQTHSEGATTPYSFNFSLGNTVGVEVDSLSGRFLLSNLPIDGTDELPPFARTFLVEEGNYYAGEAFDAVEGNDRPVAPGAAEDIESGTATTQAQWEIVRRAEVPGVKEMKNHCVPGAAARSLAWMNDLYCLGFPEDCDTAQEIYDKLKDMEHMMTTEANGTTTRTGDDGSKAVDGLNKMISDKMLGDKLMVNWNKHFDDPPTLDDLLNDLRKGKDVIGLIGWMDGATRKGGHAITIVGFIKCATGVAIYYRDDALGADNQGDNDADKGVKHVGVEGSGTGWKFKGIGANRNEGFISICPSDLAAASAAEKHLMEAGDELGEASNSGIIPDATALGRIKERICKTEDIACYLVNKFTLETATECIPPASQVKMLAKSLKVQAKSLCTMPNLEGVRALADEIVMALPTVALLRDKVDPDPTPTNTPVPPPTSTPTWTLTASPTLTPTPTGTETSTPTASSTSTATATASPSETASPTASGTPTATATQTGTPTSSNTPSPTLTPTVTVSPTPILPSMTPTATPIKRLLYSIERDYYDRSTSGLAKEGDVLIEGSLDPIKGGRYEDLLAVFLSDPEAEGKTLGLDALDAISVEGGELTRAFFSVEKSFRITNKTHPASGSIVSHGDLLTKSGVVIPNTSLTEAFDLRHKTSGQPAGDVGLDGVDVEGIDSYMYDTWTFDYSHSLEPYPRAEILVHSALYFSFEEVNEEYEAGASTTVPSGPGTLISADDLLSLDPLRNKGNLLRSGVDEVPSGVLSILADFYFGLFQPNLGLDAVDMPNFSTVSDEDGETGPVGDFPGEILFSTSRRDARAPSDFTDGDLLGDVSTALTQTNHIRKTNSMLTGLSQQPFPINLGLDGVDCLGPVEVARDPRIVPCHPDFLLTPLNIPSSTGVVRLRLILLRGCGVQSHVSFSFTYNTILLSRPRILPGPGFVLATKGLFNTESPTFELDRIAPPTDGELVAEILLDQANLPNTPNGDEIEIASLVVDGATDVAESVSPALVTSRTVPSKPSLGIPDPILSATVTAHWFPNAVIENVTDYRVTILSGTVEAVTALLPGTATSATLGGLSAGRDYILRLVAVNSAGESTPCDLEFTTRPDRNGSQGLSLLELLSRDWNPSGKPPSRVPSAVDINLNLRVNSEDILKILADHRDRTP